MFKTILAFFGAYYMSLFAEPFNIKEQNIVFINAS